MQTDLHVRKDSSRPAIGELAIDESFVTESQPIRALPFELLDCLADGCRVTLEFGRVHAGFDNHVLETGINRRLVFLPRAFFCDRHDHPAAAMGIQVDLGAEVVHHCGSLRVHRVQVIHLVKRINAGFPVGAPFADDVAHGAHLVELVSLQITVG